MIARTCVAALGMLVLVASADAQEERLRGRLDGSTHATVSAVIDSARRAGLPVEALVNKALEGASKNAPGPRIASAVLALSRHLLTARGALGAASSAAELIAGADAVQAGARQGDLARLRESRPTASLLVPLGVLTDLVARGVPVETAASVVLALAERGAGDADFLSLRRDVERDIVAGAPPAAAATVRAQGGEPAVIATPGGGAARTGTPPGRSGDAPGKGPAAGGTPPGKTAEPPGKGRPGGPPPGKGPGVTPGKAAEPPGKGPPVGQPPGKGHPPSKGPPSKTP